MRGYAQSGQYHTIVESRVHLTMLTMDNIIPLWRFVIPKKIWIVMKKLEIKLDSILEAIASETIGEVSNRRVLKGKEIRQEQNSCSIIVLDCLEEICSD